MDKKINLTTKLARDWSDGNKDAFERLYPLTYDRLRALARSILGKFNHNHSIQGTELVNELYLVFNKQKKIDINNSDHFFAISCRKFKQLIIDRYAKNNAQKNQPSHHSTTSDYQTPDSHSDFMINQAFQKLEQADESAARVAEHMIFYGFNKKETAKNLKMSERKFTEKWNFAKEKIFLDLNLKE